MIHNLHDSQSSSKRGVYNDTNLPQEIRKKYQMNSITLHLKEPEREQTKSKVNRRKEVIKIRAEINDIEIIIQLKRSRKLTGPLKR